MQNSLISGDDMRYLVQQTPEALTTIMGQMTSLVQDIADLQNDTNERVEAMEKQPWYKKMWMTITGKNKASKAEIQRNQDKIISYISEAVAQLYQLNCIDQQVMCSLGNRMNQVYAQVAEVYNEQLQMKAQVAEIMAVQQQTIQALGGFVTKLNEKIESVDNFHMLITEIQQGHYHDESQLYSLCCVLAQLDKRTLEDDRKLNILRDALTQSEIISENSISIQQYLTDVLSLPDDKVGLVYLELCNFRNSFPANLFAEMIETYHFLPKMEKMSKKKETLIQKLLDKYELDSSSEFSLADVSENFLENKKNNLINTDTLQISENLSEDSTDELKTIEFDNIEEIPEDDQEMTDIIEVIFDTILNNFDKGEPVSDEINDLYDCAKAGYVLAQYYLGYCYYWHYTDESTFHEAAKWLRKAAEQDVTQAQYHLGLCYRFGEGGVSKNSSEAVKWFKKAADKDHAVAQFQLGLCYYTGFGVEENNTEAVKWFRKAAKQEVNMAQYYLGLCYACGNGIPKDNTEAEKWYRKAAEQGNSWAQYELYNFTKDIDWLLKSAEQGYEEAENEIGCLYLDDEDYDEAFKWFQLSSEHGSIVGKLNLARRYIYGEGVDENHTEAVKLFRELAEEDISEGQFFLGYHYATGDGIEQNFTEAIKWWKLAAEQGDERAQYNLGICYENGDGVAKNYYGAVKWYRKAAEQNHVDAQVSLGICYANGNGVKQDNTEAAKWFKKAAEQNDEYAQFLLGRFYYYGWGIEEDETEAVKWWRKSAENGNAEAMHSLGVCYEDGTGVAKNHEEAEKWFKKAIENGYTED